VTRVHLTPESARRIGAAVVRVEQGGRDVPPVMFRQTGGDGEPVRLGKTTSAWNKGTLATIDLYEEGTPPSEGKKTPADTLANCVNKFATVAANKWVIVASAGNGRWYLIAAECSEE
jgi:hypothetical protein